jgi:hypothetical protein
MTATRTVIRTNGPSYPGQLDAGYWPLAVDGTDEMGLATASNGTLNGTWTQAANELVLGQPNSLSTVSGFIDFANESRFDTATAGTPFQVMGRAQPLQAAGSGSLVELPLFAKLNFDGTNLQGWSAQIRSFSGDSATHYLIQFRWFDNVAFGSRREAIWGGLWPSLAARTFCFRWEGQTPVLSLDGGAFAAPDGGAFTGLSASATGHLNNQPLRFGKRWDGAGGADSARWNGIAAGLAYLSGWPNVSGGTFRTYTNSDAAVFHRACTATPESWGRTIHHRGDLVRRDMRRTVVYFAGIGDSIQFRGDRSAVFPELLEFWAIEGVVLGVRGRWGDSYARNVTYVQTYAEYGMETPVAQDEFLDAAGFNQGVIRMQGTPTTGNYIIAVSINMTAATTARIVLRRGVASAGGLAESLNVGTMRGLGANISSLSTISLPGHTDANELVGQDLAVVQASGGVLPAVFGGTTVENLWACVVGGLAIDESISGAVQGICWCWGGAKADNHDDESIYPDVAISEYVTQAHRVDVLFDFTGANDLTVPTTTDAAGLATRKAAIATRFQGEMAVQGSTPRYVAMQQTRPSNVTHTLWEACWAAIRTTTLGAVESRSGFSWSDYVYGAVPYWMMRDTVHFRRDPALIASDLGGPCGDDAAAAIAEMMASVDPAAEPVAGGGGTGRVTERGGGERWFARIGR